MIYDDAKTQRKERKDWIKNSDKKKEKKKKDLFALRMNSFRVERYKAKEGLPKLEEQTRREIDLALNYNPISFYPINIEGQGKCIGKNYEMAAAKSLEMAKTNLANEIVHEIMLQFAYRDFVKHFGLEKAQDITQAILDVRESLADRIQETTKAMEIYNSKNHLSTEVIVRIFYNSEKAKLDFKSTLKDILSQDVSLYNDIVSFLNTEIEE